MSRRAVAIAVFATILRQAPAADLVLRAPEAGSLAFEAKELDDHAEATWQARLEQDAAAGHSGCRRACERTAAVFERLVAAAARVPAPPELRWRLAVSTNPSEGAWALAGGRVYISEALIEEYALDDDQLAFVLAHEMSHALLQHENEALSAAAAFVPRAVAQSPQNLYDEMNADLGLLLKLEPELQAEEFEADRDGMLLAGAAGYDPGGALRFLDALGRREPRAGAIIQSHPPADERVRRASTVLRSAQLLRDDYERRAAH
jgi:predicted Zn-dependent protease